MILGMVSVGDLEKAIVPVKKPLRELYPWLEELVAERKAGAIVEEKKQYRDRRVLPRSVKTAARRFLQALAFRRQAEKWYKLAKTRILRHWAQHGFTKFEGATIYASFEANLAYPEVLKALPPETVAKVVRPVQVFDLEACIQLADKGEIDRDLIAQCLGGKLEVEIRPPE